MLCFFLKKTFYIYRLQYQIFKLVLIFYLALYRIQLIFEIWAFFSRLALKLPREYYLIL